MCVGLKFSSTPADRTCGMGVGSQGGGEPACAEPTTGLGRTPRRQGVAHNLFLRSGARWLALLAAVTPAAWLAWTERDMPHFGRYHDDAVYFVSAKSLAEGQGYRLPSFPGSPWQTKYPPLYPAYLSAVWKLDAGFPGNLSLAMACTWIFLPLFLWLAGKEWQAMGLAPPVASALVVLVAFNPFVVLASVSLLSDIPFAAVMMGVLLLLRRETPGAVALAGVLATAAYLTRSSAVVLLATVPLWFLWRRKPRLALLFTGMLLPVVLAWSAWVSAHLPTGRDAATLYYFDYLGYHLNDLRLSDLPLLVWKNADSVLTAIGGTVVYGFEGWAGAHCKRLLGLAAIAGVVRMTRRNGVSHSHLFAAAYVALLVVWNFKPNVRLLLPATPFLLGGLATELGHLARLLRGAWRVSTANRAVAAVFAMAALTLGAAAAYSNLHYNFVRWPRSFAAYRAQNEQERAVFTWIARYLPPDARILASPDIPLYLHTGRQACRLPLDLKPYYRDDEKAYVRPAYQMAEFAQAQGLGYLLATPGDFELALPSSERDQIHAHLRRLPALYDRGGITLYATPTGRAAADEP